MNLIRKNLNAKIVQVDNEEGIIRAIISSGKPDRHGEMIDQSSWDFKEYLKNPVVLLFHNFSEPAVAQVLDLKINSEGMLEAIIKFAIREYDKARTIFNLYANGFMRAFSVGFMAGKVDIVNGIKILRNNVLYEVSVVNIPADALALAKTKGIDIEPLLSKGVIPYKETPKAPEDEEWDAGEEVAAAEVEDLKIMCAWFDSENPDLKGSYKLPHHKARAPHPVVWRGVAAAMAALLGARGGVDVPDEDKEGIYNHLAKHYAEFDKEPPEFEIRELEDAADKNPEMIEENQENESITSEKLFTKEGRVLSAKNRMIIERAKEALDEVLDADRISKTKNSRKINYRKILNRAIRELLEIKSNIKER